MQVEALHPLHEINNVLTALLERTRFTRYLARRIAGLDEEQAWREIAVFCVRRGHYDLVLECLGGCMRLRSPRELRMVQQMRAALNIRLKMRQEPKDSHGATKTTTR